MNNKYTELGFYNKGTGEVIDDIILDDIINKRKVDEKLKLKTLVDKLERNSESMTLSELEYIFFKKNISKTTMGKFNAYSQSNHDLESKLIRGGIKHSAYTYFRLLIADYCSNTYTIKFKNGVKLNKDAKIAEKLEISPSTWSKIKSELESKNLLRVISFEGEKLYKVNPCYVGVQRTLTPHTYYAFRDDLIKYGFLNKIQILYWDKLLNEEYLKTF